MNEAGQRRGQRRERYDIVFVVVMSGVVCAFTCVAAALPFFRFVHLGNVLLCSVHSELAVRMSMALSPSPTLLCLICHFHTFHHI